MELGESFMAGWVGVWGLGNDQKCSGHLVTFSKPGECVLSVRESVLGCWVTFPKPGECVLGVGECVLGVG